MSATMNNILQKEEDDIERCYLELKKIKEEKVELIWKNK